MQRPWGRKEVGIFRKEAGGAEARRAVWDKVEEEGPTGSCIISSFNFIPVDQEATKCSIGE